MRHSSLQNPSRVPPRMHYPHQEWDGQRSNKFGRSIRYNPPPNLINHSLELPDMSTPRGRAHFNELTHLSQTPPPTFPNRPAVQHWHLRQSKIRTMDFSPTQPSPRPERRHLPEVRHNPELKPGLRTFDMKNMSTLGEWGVQGRMGRKTRVHSGWQKDYYKGVPLYMEF